MATANGITTPGAAAGHPNRDHVLSQALTAIDSGVDALFQLDALLRTIKDKAGEYSDISRLCEVGAFLAFDVANSLDCQVAAIKREVAA